MIFLLKMNKGAKIQKLKTTEINNFFSFFCWKYAFIVNKTTNFALSVNIEFLFCR